MKEESGQSCVTLSDARKKPLAKRCTYGLVWTASATLNREGSALALAVQLSDSWREFWISSRDAGWTVPVLSPASINPSVGYVQFAGWMTAAASSSSPAKRSAKARRFAASSSYASIRSRR